MNHKLCNKRILSLKVLVVFSFYFMMANFQLGYNKIKIFNFYDIFLTCIL